MLLPVVLIELCAPRKPLAMVASTDAGAANTRPMSGLLRFSTDRSLLQADAAMISSDADASLKIAFTEDSDESDFQRRRCELENRFHRNPRCRVAVAA